MLSKGPVRQVITSLPQALDTDIDCALIHALVQNNYLPMVTASYLPYTRLIRNKVFGI